MKKTINRTHLEGYVYEHNLQKKVTGESSKKPGTEFISGDLDIATTEDLLNVVRVHFTYVTAVTSTGKTNGTFDILSNIIDGKIGSIMEHGIENAGKVSIDSAIGLNEFYNHRVADAPLVVAKRNEGGFVKTISAFSENEADHATFEADMLITGFTRVEADPDKETPEKGVLKGCVFDFRNAILPVEFTVMEPKAMDYFEGLEPSQKTPVFTKVKGIQVSKTIIKKITEEGAFGDSVREVKNSQRDYVVTWAQGVPYEWDSEDTLLASELAEKISDRELHLAEIKKRDEEYQASKNNVLAGGMPKSSTVNSGGYKF